MNRSLFLVLVLVLAAAAGGWWWSNRPVPVGVVTATTGEAAEIVYANGVVEPRTWAKVTSVIRERIVELCKCEAEEVYAGQPLGKLDDGDQRAALREWEARMTFARNELERVAGLLEKRVTTQQAYERAAAEVAQAEAAVGAARAKLDDYVLRAPMTGKVLRRDGEVGEVAEPGQVLFWVGVPEPLEVVADVNEEDIPRVTEGQRALVASDAFAGRRLEATVLSITPKGDPVAKTYRVRLSLPADTPLRIGMSVEVNIVSRVVTGATLLPRAAFEGDTVVVVEADRLVRRTLAVGIRGARAVEVKGGLAAGARVVSPYPAGLAEGTAVIVKEAP